MKVRITSAIFAAAMLVAACITFLPAAAVAQANQLMLADIVIALRSKKASLAERNDIIAKAVAMRGVTFVLTPEIEKELADTGADKVLIDSIRQKTQIIKVAAVMPPPVEQKPKEIEPPPPDFSFYQKRGDASLVKGETDAAIADYSKSIEMNPSWTGSYLGRAAALASKQSKTEAIRDYDKVIELKPENAVAQFKRAELLEQKGDIESALAGYNKTFELDPTNLIAKGSAERIVAERAKAAQKAAPVEQPVITPAPEFVDLGALPKGQVINLVMPVYPSTASRSYIGGRVIVDVVLDVDGKVVSAKANSGPVVLRQAAEAAVMKSKFRPATYKGVAIKGKGFIAYNFEPTR